MILRQFIGLCLLVMVFSNCASDTSSSISAETPPKSEQPFKIIWHWVDDFSDDNQEKIKSWLREITKVIRQTIGVYKFDVHYFLHQSDGGEPVPFAHTSRKTNQQSVHFYVNPAFSKSDFVEDWTAQHEISHLSVPFLGKENMWFSEGYATFLSRKIMINQGFYTNAEFDSIYFNRISKDQAIFDHGDLSIPELCDQLKKEHNYPSIYYAGCSYFYQANAKLIELYDTRLIDIVAKYQVKHRMKDGSLEDVIRSFDDLVGAPIFSDLLNDYLSKASKETLSYFRP